MNVSCVPRLADVSTTLRSLEFRHPGQTRRRINKVPVYSEFIADLETPVSAYLKVRRCVAGPVALLESVEGGERLARHSFIAFQPYKTLVCGENAVGLGGDGVAVVDGDPIGHLESLMNEIVSFVVPGCVLPEFYGGSIGYTAYDAVRHFEPRTAATLNKQTDSLGLPEAVYMFCDQMVIFDHVRHTIKVVAHMDVPTHELVTDDALRVAYEDAVSRIAAVCRMLAQPLIASPTKHTTLLQPPPISTATATPIAAPPLPTGATPAAFDWEAASNMGREGYESAVKFLQQHIFDGDIIQAVPSHRVKRDLAEGVTAFDVYRQLRVVNPSPYMFFVDISPAFQIVGASPEMLVKVTAAGKVYTHPIAGTRRRGTSPEEDDRLAAELLGDEKERAEHVMLVDLGRNDVGRVAAPGTVKVDSLMHIEKYSHVMHIVSNVSGTLAPDKTCYDAFRSVFPAGTVSGAPKVMAVELVGRVEKEKRHVYAGSVGYVGFSGVMDTAIAIRTIVVKNGVAYLQAGAGIVFDSVPASEYDETIAKMRGVMRAVDAACEPSPFG